MHQRREKQPQLQQLQEHVLLLQQLHHRFVLQQAGVQGLQNVCNQQQQQPYQHLPIQTHNGELARPALRQLQKLQQQGQPHQQAPPKAQQQQELQLPSSSAPSKEAGNFCGAKVLEEANELQYVAKEQQQANQQRQEQSLLKQQQCLLHQQQLLLQLGGIQSPEQLDLAVHLVRRQLLMQRSASHAAAPATPATTGAGAIGVPANNTEGCSAAESDDTLGADTTIRIARQHAAYLAAADAAGDKLACASSWESEPAAGAAAVSELIGGQKLEAAVQQLNAPAIRWWGMRQLREQQQLLLQVQQLEQLLQQQPELQWILMQDPQLLGLLDKQPGLLFLLLRNQKQQCYMSLRQQLFRVDRGPQQHQQLLQTPFATYSKLLSGASQQEQQQQQKVQQEVKRLQHERQRLTSLVKHQMRLQKQQYLQKQPVHLLQLPGEQQVLLPLPPEQQQSFPQERQHPSPQHQQGLLHHQQQKQQQPMLHSQMQQQLPQQPQQKALVQQQQQHESTRLPGGWLSQQQEVVHAGADTEEEQQPTQQMTGCTADSVDMSHEQRLLIPAQTHTTARPSPGSASLPVQSQKQSQQEQQLHPMASQSQVVSSSAGEDLGVQLQEQDHKTHQQNPHQHMQQRPKHQHCNKTLRKNMHLYSYRSVPDTETEADTVKAPAATAPSAATAMDATAKCRRRCSRLNGEPPGPERFCSRQPQTGEINCENSSSISSSSGDENLPPLQQQRQRKFHRDPQRDQPKRQHAKQRTARKVTSATLAAGKPAATVLAMPAEEAANPSADSHHPACLSHGSRGAAAASRATIAASAALQCNGMAKARGRNASAAGTADGEQFDQQQLQLLLELLQEWCSSASSSSHPPPADASASLVAQLTAAHPLLQRLKKKQEQQSALLQTAVGHNEAVSGLCSVLAVGMACSQHLLSWNHEKQQQKQQNQQRQFPQRMLMSAMKTPELNDKRGRRPAVMKRMSSPSNSSNSTFASLCGCVAVALHAEAALLSLGVDISEEMGVKLQDHQQQLQHHEGDVSLVSTAAACFKIHCRDTLIPLFSRQISPLAAGVAAAGGFVPAAVDWGLLLLDVAVTYDNADECCNFGGQGTSAADAVAALQRLLEGIRYLWSVAVSLQHPKTFSLESFHLLAAGLCCIWGVRAFPAFSVAAASLLRSAEGLLLLLFQFVPQLREPVIDGLLQQFAASADETCNQKGGGKHAAAAAAAAAAAMEEEGEDVVGPQQVPQDAAVTVAHPVTLLLLRLLQAACLHSEVYRHLQESSLGAAPCAWLEKQKKHVSNRAEGATKAAEATAKYIARRLITLVIGEELSGKQHPQQQLLLPSWRSSPGCLRAVRRLIADISLLTLSPSHPASLLLLRTVGFTILARLLRPEAAADHAQQQQQTSLLSLLSALAPAVFAEKLPVPAIPVLQEEQQQRQQLSDDEQVDTTGGATARVPGSVSRETTQTVGQQQEHQQLHSRRAPFAHSSTASSPAKHVKQQRKACCDCASVKGYEGAAGNSAETWVCAGCELRRSVAVSLHEAIGRLRPTAWPLVAAASPARSAGKAAAAATAAAEGVADSSLLLSVLDEPLTFQCILLIQANSICSSRTPAASAAHSAEDEKCQGQNPAAAAAAANASAASSAASAMRISHRRLLQQHSRAAMACLLLLLGGNSNKTCKNKKCITGDGKTGDLKENRNKSSKADASRSLMLQLVVDIEWEATAAGNVGLLPLSSTAASAAAGPDINSPWQQQQQQQLVASIWRSLALSALQHIGDLLLHAVKISAMDPRLSVRRAALSVLHASATWRPSLLQASSRDNSGIALLLPQALADPSPGVRERALALLDTALKQQQRDAVAPPLQHNSHQQLGDAQRHQQVEVAVSPWLEEIGGLLRFLRYVVLQETAPSVRQQALRVARGCAAAAPLGETARCCRSLLLEALAAAPDHPPTKAFVTAALAAEVVRFLAPKSPEKADAAGGLEVRDAASTPTQTPQKRRNSGFHSYAGSPLAAPAPQGSVNTCSSLDLPKAVRLLASLVAAAREHLEDTSLVLLLLPRMQQQLHQQLQQPQTLEELAATLLDACLSEYLNCCCDVSAQQQQQNDRSEQAKEQHQQLAQQDSLLDPTAAGASLLHLAQELGLFCPRGLLQFVPHVAVLLRDNAMLLQQSMSSSRSWLGEIELLAAAANHIRGASYHVQQEMLLCVPAVLLLLETDPLVLQAGTTMLCRVSLQLQQDGVRDSLLDLLAVSLALIYSIKDRIHPHRQPPQQEEPQQDQKLQQRDGVVPMLQALQFASWAVACLAAGLGIGVPIKGCATGAHTFGAAAASADPQWVSASIPGAASLLSDVPVALLMRRVAAHATDSKSAAAAAAAAGDGAFDLQQCIFHLLCDALLLLQQHGGMTAVAWRSVCCFVRASPSFLKSPRLGARLHAAITAAAAETEKFSGIQQHKQEEWTANASALDLPAALQALYGLIKGLQRDSTPPGAPATATAAKAAAAAAGGGGRSLQSASVPSRRSDTRMKLHRQQQQQQQQSQRTPPSNTRTASLVASSTATAAAAAAAAITANLRQGLWAGTERSSDTHGSKVPAAISQPSVCDYLHSIALYVRPMMDLLLPRQQQLQLLQKQPPWAQLSCGTATLIILLARTLQQLGLIYPSDMVPQAAALLFCSNRTVARAASLLLQEALGGAGAASVAGRMQECLDSSLMLCIHRAAPDTAAERLSKASGSGTSCSKLLQLQEEGAAPFTALMLSPFDPVDTAAVSAFVAFFTKGAKGSTRGSPSDVQLGLVAQLRRFSSVEALAGLAARLPPAAASAGAAVAAEKGTNERLAAWIGRLPASLAAVAADAAIVPWLQQTPIGLLPLLPAVFAALLHLRLVSDVLLSIIHKASEAADAAAALRGVIVDCGASVDTMLHAMHQQKQQQQQKQQHHQVAALTAAFCGCFASHLRAAILEGFHVQDAAEGESDTASPACGAAAPVDLESHECGDGCPEGAKQQQQQQQQKRGRPLVRQRSRRSSSSSSSSSSSNIPLSRRGGVPDCESLPAAATTAGPSAPAAATASKKSPVSIRRKCGNAPLPPTIPEEKAAWRLFAAAARSQRHAVATLGRLWVSIVSKGDSIETGAWTTESVAAKTAEGNGDTMASLIKEMVNATVRCVSELTWADAFAPAHMDRRNRRRKRLLLQQQQQQQNSSPPTWRRRKRRRFGVRKGEDPRDSDWARDEETSEPTAESDEDFTDH